MLYFGGGTVLFLKLFWFRRHHVCAFIMRSKTSERSDDTSPLSNGRLCAGSCEKILRTFAHSVALCNKIVLSSLVCVLVCLSIEV